MHAFSAQLAQILLLLFAALGVGITGETRPVKRGKAARGPRDWAQVDEAYWGEIEKQWGVSVEDEAARKESQRKVDELRSRVAQGQIGSTMMMIYLDGALDGQQTEELAELLRSLLLTGGVEARFYQVRRGQLILTLQKGWEGAAVYEFLRSREEVKEIQWDDKESVEEL